MQKDKIFYKNLQKEKYSHEIYILNRKFNEY